MKGPKDAMTKHESGRNINHIYFNSKFENIEAISVWLQHLKISNFKFLLFNVRIYTVN